MPYLSNQSQIEDQQLRVQELVIRFADNQLYSAAGPVVTVDLGQPLEAIVAVLHLDNSGPTAVLNAAASNSASGSVATITLANALAANDVLILKYIIA